MRILAAFLTTTLLVSGCFDDDDGDISPAQAELNQNRAAWNNSGISNYQYTFSVTCFCVPEDDITVIVVDNAVSEASYLPSGKAVSPERLMSLLTINGFFDLVQESINRDVETLNVEYDATLGYPTDIFIDQSTMIADEEVGYTIRDLQQEAF